MATAAQQKYIDDYLRRTQEFIDQGAPIETYGSDLVLQDQSPAQLEQLGPSALSNVPTGGRGRDAELEALSALEERSRLGLTAQDKADLLKIEQDVNAANRGRIGAIQQNMQARGLGGSGVSVAAQLQSAQDAAERQALLAMEQAAQSQNNRFAASDRLASIGSNLRSSDFNERARKAQAADEIARFNAANRVQAQQNVYDARNRAATANWQRRNQVADNNANNAYSYRADALKAGLGGAQLGYNAATEDENRRLLAEQEKYRRKQAKYAALGALAGGAAGAYLAPAGGGAAGATAGGQVGQAAGSFLGGYACGGMVGKEGKIPAYAEGGLVGDDFEYASPYDTDYEINLAGATRPHEPVIYTDPSVIFGRLPPQDVGNQIVMEPAYITARAPRAANNGGRGRTAERPASRSLPPLENDPANTSPRLPALGLPAFGPAAPSGRSTSSNGGRHVGSDDGFGLKPLSLGAFGPEEPNSMPGDYALRALSNASRPIPGEEDLTQRPLSTAKLAEKASVVPAAPGENPLAAGDTKLIAASPGEVVVPKEIVAESIKDPANAALQDFMARIKAKIGAKQEALDAAIAGKEMANVGGALVDATQSYLEGNRRDAILYNNMQNLGRSPDVVKGYVPALPNRMREDNREDIKSAQERLDKAREMAIQDEELLYKIPALQQNLRINEEKMKSSIAERGLKEEQLKETQGMNDPASSQSKTAMMLVKSKIIQLSKDAEKAGDKEGSLALIEEAKNVPALSAKDAIEMRKWLEPLSYKDALDNISAEKRAAMMSLLNEAKFGQQVRQAQQADRRAEEANRRADEANRRANEDQARQMKESKDKEAAKYQKQMQFDQELGEANATIDKLASYDFAKGTVPGALGGKREEYEADKARFSVFIMNNAEGIRSDADYKNIVEPMLPKPVDTPEIAGNKARDLKRWVRAHRPVVASGNNSSTGNKTKPGKPSWAK